MMADQPERPGVIRFETGPATNEQPTRASNVIRFEAGPGVDHRTQRPAPELIQVPEARPMYGEEDEAPTRPVTNPNMQAQAARIRQNRPQPRELQAEDAPTLFHLPEARSPFSRLYWTLPLADDEGRRSLLEKYVPGARFTEDRFGNPMIETNGQRYHMNRPDTFNPQNVFYNAQRIAMGLPAAAAATAATPAAAGPALVALGQGLGGAANNIASQLLPIWAGSGQRLDPASTATEAGISAVAPFLPGVVRNATRTGDRYVDLPRGVRSHLERRAGDIWPGTSGTTEEAEVGRRIASGTPGPSSREIADATINNRLQNAPGAPSGTTVTLRTPVTPTAIGAVGPRQPAGMMLDDPRVEDRAIQLIAGDNPGGRSVVRMLEQREAGRPARIDHDVNRFFGPLTADERQANQAFRQARRDYGQELRAVFSNASPIDPTPVIQRLDQLVAKVPEGTAEYNMLSRIRNSMYTKNANGDRVLVSDPEVLHNLRRDIDRLPEWGDPSVGIAPRSIGKSDYNYREVRRELSDLLKGNVPGYAEVMDKYRANSSAIDAYEHGMELLSGAGRNVTHPSQVSILLNDPETAQAFRLGARNAVETKLRTSPNDLRAIIRMAGDEGDFTRQNLVAIFGQDGVDGILQTAAREAGYQQTAGRAAATARQAVQSAAATEARSLREPSVDIMSMPIPRNQIPAGYIQRVINAVDNKLLGYGTPEYNEGMARFLTSGTPEAEEYLRGLERSIQFNQQVRRTTPAMTAITGAVGVRSDEDRPARASGGRIGFNARAKAKALINAADRAKKHHNGTTKSILDMPDETVAKALSIADQAI